MNPSELNLEIPTWVSNVLNICTSKSLYIFDNQLFKIDKSISLPTINWEQNFWIQVRLNTFEMTKSPNIQLIQHSEHTTEGKVCSKWTLLSPTRALIAKTTLLRIICMLYGPEDMWIRPMNTWSSYSIPTSPKLCNLSDICELDMEANTSFILLLSL